MPAREYLIGFDNQWDPAISGKDGLGAGGEPRWASNSRHNLLSLSKVHKHGRNVFDVRLLILRCAGYLW